LILVVLVLSVTLLAGVAFWVAAGLDMDDAPVAGDESGTEQPLGGAATDPAALRRRAPSPGGEQVVTAKLTLRSKPSGATVFRKDDLSTSLGRTPLKLRLENIGEEVEFVFRLPGYRDGEARVRVVDNTLVGVDLEELPRPIRPPEHTKVRKEPQKRSGRRVRSGPRNKRTGRSTKPEPAVQPPPKTRPPKPKKINPEDTVDPFAGQ
jgi:hypothetical protein